MRGNRRVIDPSALDPDEAVHVIKAALARTRTRRELVRELAVSAVGSAVLVGFAGLRPNRAFAQAQAQPVTAYVFGGVWKKAIAEAAGAPFTQQTGIPVRFQDPYSWAKLRAMHEAKAQQIDCASVQGTEIIMAGRLGMAEPLDWSVIDRTALHETQLARPYAIACYSLAMVLTYNTKTWPGSQHPQTWADFWDVQKFPGRRALRRDAQWTIVVALLADGVKPENFYPLDVDRAFKSLDRIKSHVKTWWQDNSQAQALIEQQEVDLIAAMDGRANETINSARAPYRVVWNEQVSTGNGQGWMVVKGGPNPAGGQRFLNIVGRPEAMAAFARMLYYAPLHPKAYDLIDPAIARQLSSFPDNVQNVHKVNYEWWADNLTSVQRRFERWLQS